MDPIDRFIDVAKDHASNPAIVTEAGTWLYSDLEAATRAFAYLFDQTKAERIAIALPKKNAAYAAFLGAGLAGAYYAPLNTSSPIGKLQGIITQLEPDVIVSEGEMLAELAKAYPSAQLICPDDLDLSQILTGSGKRHDYSHIIFTSGSTGKPKGVIIPRAAMTNFADWQESFQITPEDRISQQPNLAFDMSLTDICAAFCFGGTLYPLITVADVMMPGDFIRKHAITVWGSVPSVLSQMELGNQLNAETFASVRLVTTAGEPLFKEHLDAVFSANPNVIFQNSYGPTETTITMTCRTLTKNNYLAYCRNCVAFGDPVQNMEIHLVDGPNANEGEALIVGPQVASGYWKDPEKTKAAFTEFEGRPAYRSGDWIQRIGGEYFFKERIDFQVKIRGFRVELGEVAAAIRSTGWKVAVAFKHENYLAAIVEKVQGIELNERRLKLDLQKHIEKHAIPKQIIEVDRLPRNANDKIDSKQAAEMFATILGVKKI
jgi:D-alanine--poly(phosphoribitol) ligase subunit 1